MKRLVLCMIVKNENGIIQRAIRSCKWNNGKTILSAIAITDTGSTDNTVQLIEEVGKELNIPTKVFVEPFKSFGHNRTVSRRNAVEFAKELGWDLTQSYVIHMDADMVYEVDDKFSPEMLTHSGYNIIQFNPSMDYSNHRLDKCSDEWICIGRTHEYWSGPEAHRFELLRIDDKNDGQSKGDKFPRDLKLLNDDIEEGEKTGNNSMISRSLFYKAQTLKDMGEFDESIKTFRKYINNFSWDEEKFYAMIQIGHCYRHMMEPEESKEGVKKILNMDHAVSAWLEAWNYRPIRSEPLKYIAELYRLHGKNLLSWTFADLGSKISMPNDLLFVHKPIYSYECLIEKSIVGFYLDNRKRQEAFMISDQLLSRTDVPHHYKYPMLHRNITYYMLPIKLNGKISLNEIKKPYLIESEPLRGTYRCMNPSIIKHKGQYVINVRLVNYKQEKGVYTYLDDSGVINTKNKLLKMDKSFNIVGENFLIDSIGKDSSKSVIGLEDIRLTEHEGQIYFTTSTRITKDAPQIALCHINQEMKPGSTYHITNKTLLIGPQGEESPCEKNWLPFSYKGDIHIIYSHHPYTLMKYDTSGKKAIVLKKDEPKFDLSRFRGSASPIYFKLNDNSKGYLSIVHEVHDRDWRFYSHRFVAYDINMNITHVSLPFIFFKGGIEYVCGFCTSYDGKELLITMGVEDAEAYLVRVDTNYVRSLMYLL